MKFSNFSNEQNQKFEVKEINFKQFLIKKYIFKYSFSFFLKFFLIKDIDIKNEMQQKLPDVFVWRRENNPANYKVNIISAL